MEFRSQLLFAQSPEEFKDMLQNHARDLAEEQRLYRRRSIRITEVMNQAFAYVSCDASLQISVLKCNTNIFKLISMI